MLLDSLIERPLQSMSNGEKGSSIKTRQSLRGARKWQKKSYSKSQTVIARSPRGDEVPAGIPEGTISMLENRGGL